MCGRYTITRGERELTEHFAVQGTLEFQPRFNIAPTQVVPVIVNEAGPVWRQMRWGLVPFWAKDLSIGAGMINARGDTLPEKPAFRRSFQSRRCLVPADGFYEWRINRERVKSPVYFRFKDRGLFCFAGLWDRWQSPGGLEVLSFTIITTKANEMILPVHDRMPVILAPEDYGLWLDPEETREERLSPLFRGDPNGTLVYHSVSRVVNSPRTDSLECVQEVENPVGTDLWGRLAD
jgi:putative SOS response-associated peptidase YedK